MNANKYIAFLLARFREIHTRERMLLVAALIGVTYFLFDIALFRPQIAQAKLLREKIEQQEAEVTGLNKAVQALAESKQVDPLAKQRAELESLRTTYAQAERLMSQASSNDKMAEVIRSMIASRPGLKLVSLKTLPSDTFFRGVSFAAAPSSAASAAASPASAAASAAATPAAAPVVAPAALAPIYKHGIEVTLQGSYVDLVPYLRELERNGNGIFWSNISLDVNSYPVATLKVTLYTLSARPELPLG